MMLDIKSEQKWPLTEKSSKEQTVKGHFFCPDRLAGRFFIVREKEKEEQPLLSPTYSSYHNQNQQSTIKWSKIMILECCTKYPKLF